MGIHHETGYSADVEGFFISEQNRIRLAKSNGCTFVLAEECQFAPGTQGDLLVIVDGNEYSRRVVLKNGVVQGQSIVEYEVLAPF